MQQDKVLLQYWWHDGSPDILRQTQKHVEGAVETTGFTLSPVGDVREGDCCVSKNHEQS